MLFDCDINGDYSYCLSINSTKYEYMCRNFNAVGLRSPIMFPGPTNQKSGSAGCLLGHKMMITNAKIKKYPYVFIFEEDAYPRPDVLEKFQYLKNKIPINCGLFVMGYSGWKGPAIKINNDLFQFPIKPFGSHAYLIHSDCYDAYLRSLSLIKCPDKAFKSTNFTTCQKHPYWPNVSNILFIQKNIDCNCITSILGGERYWYPADNTGLPTTSSSVPVNFSDKLIDIENDFVKPIHKVSDLSWVYQKSLCKIEDNVIQRMNEYGDLEVIDPNKKWKITWRKTSKTELLVLDKSENNCFYYHIEKI